LRKLFQMVIEVPYLFPILLLQISSSLLTFIGLPLLIPAIDFAQGTSSVESEISKNIVILFQYFDLIPSFGLVLILLTTLFIGAEFTKLSASLLAQFSRLKISNNIKKKLISNYLKLNWTEINNSKSGGFNDSIIRQADVAGFCNINAFRIIISSIQLTTYVCLSIYISPLITILAILVYALISLGNLINHIGHSSQAKKFQLLSEEIAISVSDLLLNNKYYKTTSLLKATLKPLETIRKMFNSYLNLTIREEGQGFWVQSISFIFIVLVMFNNQMLNITFSELVLIVLIFQRLSPSFQAVQKSILDWKRELPVYDSIKFRLQNVEKLIEPMGNLILESEINVRFENVSFSYLGNNDGLKDINLNFKPNKTTAIIGESGSGKTTLVDLYLGLIRPNHGQIFYNNISHSNLNYYQLRSKIAYVGQGITLIDGSIIDNLILHEDSKDNISEKDIKKSLDRVGLLKFVMQKNEGLDYQVGENGSKLSGGQKQRLLIARGILRKTELFILDEPTSNLDIESQNEIYDAIENLNNKVTIILITHSIKHAKGIDHIYEINKGRVSKIK
jgi:ABC-type bacteriocin/lantibiotic exporter with double-glycine peptidase domain